MLEKQGNLFDSDAPAFGHGVNVDGLMGAGIALAFRNLWPKMYLDYRALCAGSLLQPGEVFVYQTPNKTVYNIASQDRPGKHARLDWLEDGLRAALSHAEGLGHDRLALPRIGCGIGGLDWRDVSPLIRDIEMGTGVEVEVWSL